MAGLRLVVWFVAGWFLVRCLLDALMCVVLALACCSSWFSAGVWLVFWVVFGVLAAGVCVLVWLAF